MMVDTSVRVVTLPEGATAALWMGSEFGALYTSSEAEGALVRIALRNGSRDTVLWDGMAGDIAPQFLRVADDLALCPLPKQALFAARLVGDDVSFTQLDAEGAALPRLIGPGQNGAIALFDAETGPKLAQLKLGEKGFGYGRALKAPALTEFGRETAIAEDADGAFLVFASNERKGFECWRYAGKSNWDHAISDGFIRYAFNSAVTALLNLPDRIVLGVGAGPKARANLFGLATTPELLVLPTAQSCHIITGEARYGPSGLLLPLTGPTSVIREHSGDYTAVAQVGDMLYAAMQMAGGKIALFALDEKFRIEKLDNLSGTVLDMGIGPNPWDELTMLVR